MGSPLKTRQSYENDTLCPLPPSGITDFEEFRKKGFVYVDKTRFIEKMERLSLYFPFIIRPRRFGKTLFTKVLEAYYDKAEHGSFERNFKGTYIYDHLTGTQGSYCVLHFDFSGLGINALERAFNQELRRSFSHFFSRYPLPGCEKLVACTPDISPAEYLNDFLMVAGQDPRLNLFVIIDEYDQFANELLSTDPEKFKKITDNGGFLKDFYIQLKKATSGGSIKRIFVTGVTIISLDSMSSGFSIGQDISVEPEFADLFGFTEPELRMLITATIDLKKCGKTVEQVVSRMHDLYNGYRFSPKSTTSVFNAALSVYYLDSLQRTGTEPIKLLDRNVINYTKIKNLLSLGDRSYVKEVVETILNGEKLKFGGFGDGLNLNKKNRLKPDDILAVLYYMGFLTFAPETSRYMVCPNRCILEQFFRYFMEEIEGRHFTFNDEEVLEAATALQKGAIAPLLTIVSEGPSSDTGEHVYSHFNESNIRTAVKVLARYGAGYRALEEPDLAGSGYADLLLVSPVRSAVSYLLELKYLKKSIPQNKITTAIEAATKEASEQLKRYSESSLTQEVQNLKKVSAVFHGTKLVAVSFEH